MLDPTSSLGVTVSFLFGKTSWILLTILSQPVSFLWLERKVKEWGCMQALIDYDGWRKWKAFGDAPSAATPAVKKIKEKEKEKEKSGESESAGEGGGSGSGSGSS